MMITYRRHRKFPALLLAMLTLPTLLSAAYQITPIATDLNRPTGLAIQGDRILYIAEAPEAGKIAASNAIRILDLETRAAQMAVTGLAEPMNLALDTEKRLVWTDRTTGEILMRSPDGTISILLSGLKSPTGLSVGREHFIYFTEVPTPGMPGSSGGSNTVSRFDGQMLTVLSPGDAYPADVAANRRGDVYWTDASAGTILHRDRNGAIHTLLSGLKMPTGLALDADKRVLYFTEVPMPGVADPLNTVNAFNLRTFVRTVIQAGDPEPRDVAVSESGTIYWTSTSRGAVYQAVALEAEGDEYEAELEGGNEVPPVDTEAEGEAEFRLASDQSFIEFQVFVEDIIDVTASHIHLGDPGVAGPVVFPLIGAAPPPGSFDGMLASGVITPDGLVGPLAGDWAGFLDALFAGGLYVNVHTAAYPGGEIRGQILLDEEEEGEEEGEEEDEEEDEEEEDETEDEEEEETEE